jgi:hypothetical protein
MAVQVMQPIPAPTPVTLPDILQTGLGLGTAIQQFRALPQAIRQAQQEQAARTAYEQALTGAVPSAMALRMAQAGAIPSEIGLRQAQAFEALAKAQQAKTPGIQEFQKQQGKRFSADLSNVATVAQFAKEHEIPHYQAILKLLDSMSTKTGPGASLRYWGSSDIQKLTALCTQAVFDEVKNIHLGRWTQREVQWLQQAVGNPNMLADTLKYLFSQKLAAAQNALTKQKFYSDYRKGGGLDPDDIALRWAQQRMPIDFGMPLREGPKGELTAVLPASPEEAATQPAPPGQPGFFERLFGGLTGHLQLPLPGVTPGGPSAQPAAALPQPFTGAAQLRSPLSTIIQQPPSQGGLYSSVLGRYVSQADIDQTARAHGDSIEEVKSKLGIS